MRRVLDPLKDLFRNEFSKGFDRSMTYDFWERPKRPPFLGQVYLTIDCLMLTSTT